MTDQSSVSAGEPTTPRILIVTTSRQAHHPFLRDLTAAPSILGSRYIVVTMHANNVSLNADEPFTVIIIDNQHIDSQVIPTLQTAAPHTPLLIVAPFTSEQTPTNEQNPHEITTSAQLRSAVAQILHKTHSRK